MTNSRVTTRKHFFKILLENLQEMFPWYHMDDDVSRFKYGVLPVVKRVTVTLRITMLWCVTRR